MAWNLVKADGKKIPTGAICLSSQNDRNGDQYLAVKDDRYLLLRNVIIIGKAAIDNVNGKHTFWYAEAGNERKTFDFFWVVPKSESCLQIKKNQDNNPGPESMKLGYENEQEYYAVIVESKNGTIPGKKSALGPAIYTYGYNVCEEWNNFYWIDLCLERDPVVPVPENLPETFWEQQIGLPRPSASHLEQMAIFVFILPTNATDQSDVISFYPNTRRGISNIMTTMTQRQLNVARILIGGRLNFARFTTMHTGTIDNLGQFRLDYQSYHLYHATENQYANLQVPMMNFKFYKTYILYF